MWKQLQNLPRHEHNHAFLLRHFGSTDIIRSWFDSTIQFYSQIHCDSGNCSRRVCKMPNGKMLAVCNDNYGGCPDLPVTQNDIRLHTLNLLKIAGSITADAEAAFLFADAQLIGEVVNSIRVGFYMPRGTIRYPVFLSVPIYDGDLNAALNYLLGRDAPAIMLLPSLDDVSQAKQHAVQAKRSSLIGLQDLQGEDCLLDIAKASELFNAFHEQQKDPFPDALCELFSTPPGAEWSQITIKFTDGHTARVTCKTGDTRASQLYNFTQMGMADGRTASPNKQWELLQGFADERGQFTWDNPKANRNQKKQKQELKKVLQKFFGIYDSDPFEDFKDHKQRVCYRSKLNISPED
jgi:hypothetical protein